MSIKLYNGYIIRGRSIEEVYPRLLQANDYVFSFLEQVTLFEFDELLAHDGSLKMSEIKEKLDTYNRSGAVPLDSSLVLIPDGGDILLLMYGGRIPELLYNSKLNDLMEEYGYWDNTDCPEDVAEEEWEARHDRWERVLRDWQPAGRVGLILDNSFEQVWKVVWMPEDYKNAARVSFFPELEE